MKLLEIKIPLINELTINDMEYLYKFDEGFGDSFYISKYALDYINIKLGFDSNNLQSDLDNFANYIRKNTNIAKKFYLDTKDNNYQIKKRDEILVLYSTNPAGDALLEDLLIDNNYSIEKISDSKYRIYGLEETKIPYRQFKEIWSN